MNHTAHILGAGGIGIAAGVCLARAGWSVTMVDSNSKKIDAGKRNGMSVDGQTETRVKFVSFQEWAPPTNTPILLCVKTFDNAPALQRISNIEHVVPIQNGFDAQLESLDHPAEAIASFVSECAADQPATRITRAGALHIGARKSVTAQQQERIQTLADALAHGKLFPVESVANVLPFKVTKLMYNAAISPLAASAGVDNAQLLTDPLAQKMFFALLRENFSILRNAGLEMATIGPFHPNTVMRILRTPLLPKIMGVFFRPSLRGTYCSMSPDMGSGRTEVDAYNGHLIRLAGKFPCPINRAVVALVEKISRERLAPSHSHLRALAATLARGVLA
ncbi:MAG: ketopantoate reductase family protein [Phycisphaerales bacterium]|nr:ketopantoate reductase family protein [Phycisphaerales bacterium]